MLCETATAHHDVEGIAHSLREGYLPCCSVVLLSKLSSHDPFGRQVVVPRGCGRCDALQLTPRSIPPPRERPSPLLLRRRALGVCNCVATCGQLGWARARTAQAQDFCMQTCSPGFLGETNALAAAHMDRLDPATVQGVSQQAYAVNLQARISAASL